MSLTYTNLYFSGKYGIDFWIGLYRSGTDIEDWSNNWMWKDGTRTTYLNWYLGEPNDPGDPCARFSSPSGNWRDRECADLFQYVCEKGTCFIFTLLKVNELVCSHK